MHLLVAGSRGITWEEWLSADFKLMPTSIISGGARGPDSFGVKLASDMGIPCEIITPDWNRFGRMAGMYRNSTLVERCEGAWVLWDGESSGTQDTMQKLRRSGKPWECWIRGLGYYDYRGQQCNTK